MKLGLLKHSGVVVVLDDGRQYLIHKVMVTVLNLSIKTGKSGHKLIHFLCYLFIYMVI